MSVYGNPGNCVRDLPHEFDAVSGWCARGCGFRDDGRSQYRNRRTWNKTDVVDVTEPRRSVDRD